MLTLKPILFSFNFIFPQAWTQTNSGYCLDPFHSCHGRSRFSIVSDPGRPEGSQRLIMEHPGAKVGFCISTFIIFFYFFGGSDPNRNPYGATILVHPLQPRLYISNNKMLWKYLFCIVLVEFYSKWKVTKKFMKVPKINVKYFSFEKFQTGATWNIIWKGWFAIFFDARFSIKMKNSQKVTVPSPPIQYPSSK